MLMHNSYVHSNDGLGTTCRDHVQHAAQTGCGAHGLGLMMPEMKPDLTMHDLMTHGLCNKACHALRRAALADLHDWLHDLLDGCLKHFLDGFVDDCFDRCSDQHRADFVDGFFDDFCDDLHDDFFDDSHEDHLVAHLCLALYCWSKQHC